MASTYSNILRLEKQANGENDNTWGDILNATLELIEDAIAGRAAITHSDAASYTLTTNNGSADEARNAILNIAGALTAARNTVVPTSSRVYVAKNATTGGFATTLKTAAGTGIEIPNGKTTLLMCDATNVVSAIDYLPALAIGGVLTVDGNVTLGNGSGDTLTINAGTWTIGSNYTATRAAGTVAAGSLTLASNEFSAAGDAGGTSAIIASDITVTLSGANAISAGTVSRQNSTYSGSSTLTTSFGVRSGLTVSSTGNVTTAHGFRSAYTLSSSGNITSANGFTAAAPAFSSTGAITTLIGFAAQNLGDAALVTNAIGFEAASMTAALTLTAGYRGRLTSGTGKYNLYMDGTAENFLEGIISAGATGRAANGLVATVLGSIGPTGANTTVQEWLKVKSGAGGTTRYIPMF